MHIMPPLINIAGDAILLNETTDSTISCCTRGQSHHDSVISLINLACICLIDNGTVPILTILG